MKRLQKIRKALIFSLLLLPYCFSWSEAQEWRQIGPTAIGLRELAVSASDPSVLYAADLGSGIYKSVDRGESWRLINATLPNTFFDLLAVDPTTPEVVYAGGNGPLYRSVDGGRFWVVSGETPFPATALAIDPLTTTTLYAGSDAVRSRVFRSADRGAEWVQLGPGLPDARIDAIVVNPSTPSTLFVAAAGEVYRSADGGDTWVGPSVGTGGGFVADLAIDPVNTNILYFALTIGVYKSIDSGDTWSPTFLQPAILDFTIDPTVPSTLYVARYGGGLFRSTDSGESWADIHAGLDSLVTTQIAVDPTDSATLYTTLNGGTGVFKSVDGGDSWRLSNTGLRGGSMQSIAIAPADPAVLYTGAFDGGLYRTANAGASWQRGLGPVTGFFFAIAVDPIDPAIAYAANGGTIYKSTDQGQSWIATSGEFSVNGLAVARSAPTTLFAGGAADFSVARSTNGGDSWSVVNNGLAGVRVNHVAVDPTEASIVYAGTLAGAFKSVDGGDSWSLLEGGLPGQNVQGMAVDPMQPSTVYAGTLDGIYKSVDGGSFWTLLPGSPRFVSMFSKLEVSPSHPQIVYAASDSGIFRSMNGGASWTDLGEPSLNGGLTTLAFVDLAVDPVDPLVVYLATAGGGVFTNRRLPSLTIPDAVPVGAGETVSIPIELDDAGEALAAVAFSIDHDETCLDFDPTDANFDGIPDAFDLQIPADFTRVVGFDPLDHDGEIDILVAAPAPGTIPGGTLASVTFTAICPPPAGSSVLAGVDFSSAPLASFADTGGATLAGATVDGSVEIFADPPKVEILQPDATSAWPLSDPNGAARTEVIRFMASDNLWICQVEVSLLFSNDGGATFLPAPPGGGLPGILGPGGDCPAPGVEVGELLYTVPRTPPSGTAGSLYRVEVRVVDREGLEATAESEPFLIVESAAAKRTLILTHIERMRTRMGLSDSQVTALRAHIVDLARHPRVEGLLVDLAEVTNPGLWEAWDTDPGDPVKANRILFAEGGVQEALRALLETHGSAEYLILVGDDRIVPMARITDRTVIFPESNYTSADPADDPDAELTPTGATVGQALGADRYLSDDPIASRERILPEELDLEGFHVIPDLLTGRLVETPEEIRGAITTFLSRGGVLDLSRLDPVSGHKVQVVGYDFLLDSAKSIRKLWREALGQGGGATAPVDGELIGQTWSEATLREHLCGNGGEPYGLLSLNGHATHYEEGVALFGTHGLSTAELIDPAACDAGRLRLPGHVAYSVGCHSGLPVAGTTSPDEHPLDLPQTMLALGLSAYVANTGYAWGLLCGIGYSEKLVEIMTEELIRGGTESFGGRVRETKRRYFEENLRFDPYDIKTSMQWTLFGFPMYRVRTGIPELRTSRTSMTATRTSEKIGPVTVEREFFGSASAAIGSPQKAVPAHLSRLELRFDFTADGVYTKRDAAGDVVAQEIVGCPDPKPGDLQECLGCYYTLNGRLERTSGEADLPLQPTFVYESRLPDTSQHGILWKGASYDEEPDWVPLFAQLVSNGGDGSNHGLAPRKLFIPPRGAGKPQSAKIAGETCTGRDEEVNAVVITTGETLDLSTSDESNSLQRLHRVVDLEAFYYNNREDGAGNCDRAGPLFDPGPYHQVTGGSTIEWEVAVSDEGGVWRVLVVYDDEAKKRWTPLELTYDAAARLWRGHLQVFGTERLTYFLQAVDQRGNVSWLEYQSPDPPASGVPLGLPLPVDVDLSPGGAQGSVIFDDDFETGTLSRWSKQTYLGQQLRRSP